MSEDNRPILYVSILQANSEEPEILAASFDPKVVRDETQKAATEMGMWVIKLGASPAEWSWGGDEGEIVVIRAVRLSGNALDLMAASVT